MKLSVGLLLITGVIFLACSREFVDDDKTSEYDHYCPDVPSHVVCPSGSGSDNGSNGGGGSNGPNIVSEYFDLNAGNKYAGIGSMYYGRYYPTDGYFYLDNNFIVRSGCIPVNETPTTAYWWNDLSRNSTPPYVRCYRAWITDNATVCDTAACVNYGPKTVFTRTIMIHSGWDGTEWTFATAAMPDNQTAITGTTRYCNNYPNGTCPTSYSTIMAIDNHTGKVKADGSYDGQDFPHGIFAEDQTSHKCLLDNGSSCAYTE